jgi:Ankyrin repeat
MSWFWGRKKGDPQNNNSQSKGVEATAGHHAVTKGRMPPKDEEDDNDNDVDGDAPHPDANDGDADADHEVESKRPVREGTSHGSQGEEADDHEDKSSEDDDDDDETDGSENDVDVAVSPIPPQSFESVATDDGDDDISMIHDDDDLTSDDDFLDSSSSSDDEDHDDDGAQHPPPERDGSAKGSGDHRGQNGDDGDNYDSDDEPSPNSARDYQNGAGNTAIQAPALSSSNDHPAKASAAAASTTNTKDSKRRQDDKNKNEEADDEELVPTSFWEKQSLLMLAAEHDRVDILKAILADDDDDRDRLMNGGVPPLHLAINFGSVNTTQSLLRMGADPSARPNVDEILREQEDQPEDSKVEIANIRRFHGVSAWELAFGNRNYERMPKKSNSWSLFGSSSSSLHERRNDNGDGGSDISTTRVIKPVDMAPSKREGVRHAFTAEALRCVGGDESDRLQQLLNSGMPATIDIGGKNLYSWAVEMGALKCEELLRPSEAARFGGDDDESNNEAVEPVEGNQPQTGAGASEDRNVETPRFSFVIHRPGEETVPQLANRLDELESLSTALSTCLDNLAEEVSVCHGLLILGGGASALASHVKSLKMLKMQKFDQLEQAETENEGLEEELLDLIHSSGEIGREIDNLPSFKFFTSEVPTDQREKFSDINGENTEAQRRNLAAQIAASENKVRQKIANERTVWQPGVVLHLL